MTGPVPCRCEPRSAPCRRDPYGVMTICNVRRSGSRGNAGGLDMSKGLCEWVKIGSLCALDFGCVGGATGRFCAPRREPEVSSGWALHVVERGHGNTHCGGLCAAPVHARYGARLARHAGLCAKRRAWGRRYSLPFTSAAPIWNAFFISSGKTVSWRFFFASASKYHGQSVLL